MAEYRLVCQFPTDSLQSVSSRWHILQEINEWYWI